MGKCPLCGQQYVSESLLGFHLVNWHDARVETDTKAPLSWSHYLTRPVPDTTSKAVL